MFCPKCGEKLPKNAEFCSECGASIKDEKEANRIKPSEGDSGSIGWGILGFFFPIVGLILFLVWKETKPASSKVAGIGGLIGFCAGILLRVLATVLRAMY